MNTSHKTVLIVFAVFSALLSLTNANAEEKRDATLAGWSTITDPDNDCQISSNITIEVPNTNHDLNPRRRMNAPRLLTKVTGDFSVQVKVTGDFKPGGTSTGVGRPFNGAGLLIWQNENKFLRMERNAYWVNESFLCYPPLIEYWRDGEYSGVNSAPTAAHFFKGRSTWLKLKRQGERMTASFSHDGEEWTIAKEFEVDFPDEVSVGIAALNTSDAAFSVEFEEFEIKPDLVHADDNTANAVDKDLAVDLALLQGSWQQFHGNEGTGPPTIRSVKTIEGNTETLRRYSVKTGELRASGRVEFKLTKSGNVRVFTFYPPGGSPENGGSYVYRVDKDNFYDVPGLLHGDEHHNYQSQVKVWHWKRIVEDDSEARIGQPWRKHASSLIVVNVDGSDPIDVSNREMSYFGSPQWSRDGRRIAYDAWNGSGGDFRNSHIFVCDADGSNVIDLGRGAMPSWSADGTQVVGHTYDGPTGLYLMSTDGKRRRELAIRAWSPSWSPVGEAVAFLPSGHKLSQIDLKTREIRPLLEDGWRPGLGFAWSPDGRHIAFRKSNELAIANLDPHEATGDVRVVAKVASMSTGVAWSPDGKQIAFAARKDSDDPIQIYTIDVEGDSKPERIPWQEADRNNSSACWSPDGKRMVYLTEG